MSARDVKSAIRAIRQSALKRLFDRKRKRTVDLRGPVKFLFDQRQNLIGDMLVNTIAFRAIKDKYPHWQVHVLAGPDNREVVRENACVDRIHRMTDTVSGVAHLRAEHFDVFYFHQNRLRLQDFILLKYTDARINIGRAKSEYQLFDHSLDDPGGTANTSCSIIHWMIPVARKGTVISHFSSFSPSTEPSINTSFRCAMKSWQRPGPFYPIAPARSPLFSIPSAIRAASCSARPHRAG